MKNILISGLFNIETTLNINQFPVEYNPIEYKFFGIQSSVSGVAVNIAKAEKMLGNEVSVLSYIGKDMAGDNIISEIHSAEIKTNYIKRELQKSPSSIVLFDEDGRRKIYCDLTDIQDKMYNVVDAEEAIDKCDIAVLCNINFNRELLKTAKNKGKIVATDLHVLSNIYDEYNKDFMEVADILFLSDEGIPYDHKEFLLNLKNTYGAKVIVVGRGKKGAMIYLCEEDIIYDMKAVTVGKVENTVGAGDALFSAFINYYAKGFAPIEALKRAEIFASYKIGFNGAATGFINEEKVEEIYRNIQFEFYRY